MIYLSFYRNHIIFGEIPGGTPRGLPYCFGIFSGLWGLYPGKSGLGRFISFFRPKQELPEGNLNPEFQKIIYQLLKKAHSESLNVYEFSGFRSFEEQNKLYNKIPRVTKARGGMSWHNYGLAVDIVFKDSRRRWSWANKHNWKRLGEIGKELGLFWGGDFRSFSDRPHFQYTKGLKISEAKRLHDKGGLLEVWKELEKR